VSHGIKELSLRIKPYFGNLPIVGLQSALPTETTTRHAEAPNHLKKCPTEAGVQMNAGAPPAQKSLIALSRRIAEASLAILHDVGDVHCLNPEAPARASAQS